MKKLNLSQKVFCGLRSAVCGLRSVVCGLRSVVCGLRSAVCVFTRPAKDLSPETLEFAVGSALEAFVPLGTLGPFYESVAHLFSGYTKFDINETKAGLTERRVSYRRPFNSTSGRPLKG